jgi:hypothetical protein
MYQVQYIQVLEHRPRVQVLVCYTTREYGNAYAICLDSDGCWRSIAGVLFTEQYLEEMFVAIEKCLEIGENPSKTGLEICISLIRDVLSSESWCESSYRTNLRLTTYLKFLKDPALPYPDVDGARLAVVVPIRGVFSVMKKSVMFVCSRPCRSLVARACWIF